MKMRKKVLSMLLIGAMAATLFTGCGTKDEESSTTTTAAPAATSKASGDTASKSNLEESLAIDSTSFIGSDGKPLLMEIGGKDEIPDRPADPDALPEDNILKYWDIEYAGWKTEKETMPESPKDGAIGKKVIMIGRAGDAYWTAIQHGAQQMAEGYKFDYTYWNANNDLNQQNQLIDKAIAAKPDMVLIGVVDANAAVQQFKKLYDAGIPVIALNMVPTDEAMKYALALTGPDDFGQFKMLTRWMAEKVGGKGGVCYLSHLPGGSPYFARTFCPISILKDEYPDMKRLDIQSPGFDAPKVKQVVSDWLTRFGDELTCIVAADDAAQGTGISQALKEAGREDIVVIAAGNSKVGMDLVKSGDIDAITWQSAESDGALPVKLAADWFDGVEIPPVAYLPQAVITQDTVDSYMPGQW